MDVYIKNPDYEFIEDERSIVVLEPEMNEIFSADIIGLKVIEKFSDPVKIEDLPILLQDTFTNINTEELDELVSWLKENKIIVPYIA